MQTPPLPPFRSGHLDINDAQCDDPKDVLKKLYQIISRFWVMGVQKVQKDAQKIKLPSKVAKLAGTIRNDLIMIFCINTIFLRDS